jgi:hypothetical protein
VAGKRGPTGSSLAQRRHRLLRMHRMYIGIKVGPKNEAFAAQVIYCYFLEGAALPPPANCSQESTTTIKCCMQQLGKENRKRVTFRWQILGSAPATRVRLFSSRNFTSDTPCLLRCGAGHLAFTAPGALEARAAFASDIFFLSASPMLPTAEPGATPLDTSAAEPLFSSPVFADADDTAAPPNETDLYFFSSAARETPAAA